MNINNTADTMIDCVVEFLNRLDLFILTKVNKRFNKYKSNKSCKFALATKYCNRNLLLCHNAAHEGYLDILKYLNQTVLYISLFLLLIAYM